MIAIRHIHRSILAGSPYWASFCANEYLPAKLRSESFQICRPCYGDGRTFPMDKQFRQDEASTIHGGCDVLFQHTGGGIMAVQPAPKYGIVFHNKNGQLPAAQQVRPAQVFCVPQKQFFAYPEGTVKPFPNFIPVEHEPFTPDETRVWAPPLKVCFTPSNKYGIGAGGDNSKGYQQTVNILERLKAENLVEPHIIMGKDHIESLQLRRQCHIAIDECATGSYHRCSLEAASMGMVPISAVTDDVRSLVADYTGAGWAPFHSVGMDCLEDYLRRFAKNPQRACHQAMDARDWMLSHWHPEKLWPKVLADMGVEL